MKLLKAFFIVLIIIVFTGVVVFNSDKLKVLDVIDYKTVVIDLNKNFQKDEGETISFDELYIPDNISDEDKFLIKYLADNEALHFLMNKYINYSSETNALTANDKDFVRFMTDSHLVLNSKSPDEQAFREKLDELKKENYVLVNTKSKRYHKLNCETGITSRNYKLVPLNSLENDLIPCKSCIDITPHKQDKKQPKQEAKVINQTPIADGDIRIFPLGLNEIKEPVNECYTKACQALLNEINNAQNRIFFAIYGIHNQDKIVNALMQAKERGVEIKWVTDYSYGDTDYYPDTRKLEEILTDFKDDYSDNKTFSSKLMHNKFFIFDENKVFTGSSNVTQTDLTGFNANYAVLINSKEIADIYTEEFNQMYSGKFHNQKERFEHSPITFSDGTQISVFFSPNDKIITKQLIPLIDEAKNSIDISIFCITHKKLKEALISAHNRGVKIRIINDATNASNMHSIHQDLRKSGISVKTENYAGKNHSKVMIVDDLYSVIGSMNFTSSGENYNDENVLIIKSSYLAKEMTKSFNLTWRQIDDEYLRKDPSAESLQSVNSCFDGVDNDFDGKIDMFDEGCKRLGI